MLVWIAVFLVALYWDGIVNTCENLWSALTPSTQDFSEADHTNIPNLEPLIPEQVTEQALTGKVCAVLLFVDDETTAWTQEEAVDFTKKYIQPGVDFLHQQAVLYGAELELSTLIYTSNENRQIYYNGNIGGGFTAREENDKILVYPDNTKRSMDVLEHIADNWGMDSVEQMRQALIQQSGAHQIRFVVISNKGGWACANGTKQTCYLYAKDHYDREPAETTFPHEFLHLFGAEDLYMKTDMEGTVTGKNRQEMTMQMHPNAIMHGGFMNIADGMVCGYTAYLVGWLDELPPEYNCEEWWS